jgi:hypothetical protein
MLTSFKMRLKDFNHWDVAAVASISAVFFLYIYLTFGFRPSPFIAANKGWFGFCDQSLYLKMAKDLSHFSLTGGDYIYGLGYPILGALFFRFMPWDPFLIPNLVSFTFITAVTYIIAARFMKKEHAFIAAMLFLFATGVVELYVIPWNSTVSGVALAAVLYFSVSSKRITWPKATLVGVLAGWVFAARYLDVLFILPIAAFILWNARHEHDVWKSVLGMFIGLSVVVGLVLLSHYIYFGSALTTPYAFHPIVGESFSNQDIRYFSPTKTFKSLFQVFVFFHYGPNRPWMFPPLLVQSFIFVFSPLGFFYLVKKNHNRSLLIVLGVTLVAALLIYGSARPVEPENLQFFCLHYFKMWFPILTIFSTAGLFGLWEVISRSRSVTKEGT